MPKMIPSQIRAQIFSNSNGFEVTDRSEIKDLCANDPLIKEVAKTREFDQILDTLLEEHRVLSRTTSSIRPRNTAKKS